MILAINDDMVTNQRLLAAGEALNADLERYLVVLMADYQEKSEQDLQEMATAVKLLKASPVTGSKQQMAEISPISSQLQGEVQYLLDIQTSDATVNEIIRTSLSAYTDIGNDSSSGLLALTQEAIGRFADCRENSGPDCQQGSKSIDHPERPGDRYLPAG